MSGVSIKLKSLHKALGGRAVLSDLALEVQAEEWLALIGPSGSGKTTLLRLISGLESPDSGDILFDGLDMALVPARERKIGMVFQDLALWPYLTVEDHLRVSAGKETGSLIDQFGLAGLERKRPHELSGGERQRLALARAVSHNPRLLLLDEPFTHLDPLLRRTLADLLGDLHRKRGLTTIYVSHYFDAPVCRATRAALLRDGRIEQAGTLSELRANPRNDWVAAFIAEEAEIERA